MMGWVAFVILLVLCQAMTYVLIRDRCSWLLRDRRLSARVSAALVILFAPCLMLYIVIAGTKPEDDFL